MCARGPPAAVLLQPLLLMAAVGGFGEKARAAGADPVCRELDLVGTSWPAPLPQSCDHSRLRVTAPCSNWPVTLRALGEGGAGLCEAAMATGPFNESERTVTNDIPEPIGYTANGQFAASLTVLHNSTQAQRTHLSGAT